MSPPPPAGRTLPSDRYGSVLLLLLASFVLSAFLPQGRIQILPLVLYLAALTLALGRAHPLGMGSRRFWWAISVPSAAAVAVNITVHHRAASGVVSLWLAVILALTIVVVVRQILAHQVVTMQTIFGALSAYLLIGFLFAALFSAVGHLQTAPLFSDGRPATGATIQYFSFVTMTTVGYGDFAADGEPARTLAVLDALTGQIFLITLVARLVSLFGSPFRNR
ncbi:ion channel [Micromonospora sp. NPDC050417]|uniref:ion channel n=1 Tax=Micromonospora sp. NPDC050417 TaxID=3364280 RepID=UPI00379CD564